MKDTDYVWGAAAVIILIGIYTHTKYIQNFIAKVKNQHGFANPTFDYRNTESIPRVSQDQLEEMYPEDGRTTRPYPNQHLCTGECKSGTCDSQGFCIDSGCGSVIRGESQCEEENKKKKHKKHTTKTTEKSHRNTIPRLGHVFPFPSIEIPALNPAYNQTQPTYDQDLTSPSTPTTDIGDNPFDNLEGDQQQIQPTVPSTSPTIPTPPQHVYTPPPPPQPQPSGGTYYLDKMWNNKSCGKAPNGDSCRRQGPIQNPTGNYRLDATVSNYNRDFYGMEITSGGFGSADDCCCGVTLGVHGPSSNGAGYVYAKTEDWTPYAKSRGHAKYICDDSGGNRGKGGSNGLCNPNPVKVNLNGGPVHLMWQVQNTSQGHATYSGSINGVTLRVVDPKSWDNKIILPGRSPPCKNANDPTRVRVDGGGTGVVFTDSSGNEGVKVTPLS